jgi:FMN phosphatase YigB (HAD superfamily)
MSPTSVKPANDLVFLIDVDNTLLDNDSVIKDLRQHLVETLGRAYQVEYWRIFEELRRELGYADYLGALQRYRLEHPREPEVLSVSLFLLSLPFADRLYPRALEVIAHLRRRAPVVILSDGDAVFQPYKVERSGLWAAVAGDVLIYIHKERVLDDVERRYPAEHYVMVDDKLRILTAMKKVWGKRVTTVFVARIPRPTSPSSGSQMCSICRSRPTGQPAADQPCVSSSLAPSLSCAMATGSFGSPLSSRPGWLDDPEAGRSSSVAPLWMSLSSSVSVSPGLFVVMVIVSSSRR